ncbi:hypothetical protein V8C42DRAFT_359104 [Trichoderma barbatum]
METNSPNPAAPKRMITWGFCIVEKTIDGYIIRLPERGEAIAEATAELFKVHYKDTILEPLDEHLVAMEVHGRCRFMWDTSSFRHDALPHGTSTRSLYDQITGHVENDGYFVDAAYVGYSMYVEGPVFMRKMRESQDPSEVRSFSFRGNEFRIEPGGKEVGMAFIPHSGIATRVNLLALKTWIDGSSVEEAFGNAMPFERVAEQAEGSAEDLADGRNLAPVTRMPALNIKELPKGTMPNAWLKFPNEAEGFDNPCLTELMCDATLLSRDCARASGFLYRAPGTSVMAYPERLLEMLRNFARKYTKDRLTERSLLLAAYLWANITKDPESKLELFAKERKWDGEPYQPVPTVSLAQCLIYYPHWLRWVVDMALAEFVHPFRFISKAVETDLANNVNAGMEVEANDIDQDEVLELLTQAQSMHPGISPYTRVSVFPYMLPGSDLPPLCRMKGTHATEFDTAVVGLDDVNFLGLPTYEAPRASESQDTATRPTTFVLVQPPWAAKPVCQDMVMPYREYMKRNPEYPGYELLKKWTAPKWRITPAMVFGDEEKLEPIKDGGLLQALNELGVDSGED